MLIRKSRVKMMEKQNLKHKRNEKNTRALRRQQKKCRVVVYIQEQSLQKAF